ncbi:MAG TPA: hypothetical protein VGK93_08225 [Candidatus Eisenbacteria bacterium]|jgi:hypothetical protein
MIGLAREGRRWRPLAERLIAPPAGPDERWFCTDIDALDDAALRAEVRRLRAGLLLAEHPDAWAQQRLGLLLAELEARGAH